MICSHLAAFILLNDIHRANHRGVRWSKTRFIHLALNDVQHANTPVLSPSRRIYEPEANTPVRLYRSDGGLTLIPYGGIFDWPSFRPEGPAARREDQVFSG